MYSTRLVNSHMVANNAYITVGDPYKDHDKNPFRKSAPLKEGEKPPAPFHIRHKPANAENGCFTKVEYKGGDCQEVVKYLATQPLDARKRGFGTKDAKRRDEFANAMRTEQYRATIRREQELMRLQQQNNSSSVDINALSIDTVNPSDELFQFDIGRSRVTEFDPKSKRDTYYKIDHSKERSTMGDSTSYLTTSTDWGSGVQNVEYKAPDYGGHSTIRHFYDKSHLHL